MKFPIRLFTFRTQFPLDTPLGMTAMFTAKRTPGDGGNCDSIEQHESGLVVIRGNKRTFTIFGLNVGRPLEEPEPAAAKPKQAARGAA